MSMTCRSGILSATASLSVLLCLLFSGCKEVGGDSPRRDSSEKPQNRPSLRTATLKGMVFIKGGTFTMGTKDGFAYEGPPHEVTVNSFWMDKHEVTVAEFERFVKATRYVTEAEKFRWSGVLADKVGWKKVDGADWRHPEGPNSRPQPDEPVCQVSWNDTVAFGRWAKKRLPTEAEFEYAARGGLDGKRYSWGDELRPGGKCLANWWQGVFPEHDKVEDGYHGRCPVGKFPANPFGLYDITGNVWEWCADRFGEDYYKRSPRNNPKGPDSGKERVLRGGSWMCSENYCTGYRVASRMHTEPDSGLNNMGFRCVQDE